MEPLINPDAGCITRLLLSWSGGRQSALDELLPLVYRELRRLAEDRLGTKFDVRQFHDAVLGAGAVPLDVLEENVKLYIAKAQNASES